MENKIVANNGSSIVLYTTDDGNTQLEVKLEKDTVWLNREQIAQLYGRDYKTIAKHINNALREELEGEPVVAKFATPKKYGRKEGYTQMQKIDYYNLDMIISVGYRVKSRNGIVFRKWANSIYVAVSRGEKPFFQRWQQTYCCHALPLVHGEEWHTLWPRRT